MDKFRKADVSGGPTVRPGYVGGERDAILERISDAVFAIDRQWRFTYVNHQVERMSGKRREELIGRNAFEVFPQAFGSESHAAMLRAMEENQPVSYQTRSTVTGRWIEATVYPDASGLSAFVRDITERRQTEAELQASEERLRLAIEGTGLGTWDYDPVSGKRTWSDEFKAILGLPCEAEPGFEVFAERIHPDDRDWVNARYRSMFDQASGGDYDAEFRIRRASDGAERWVVTRGRILFDAAGKPRRSIGTLMDVTERKRAEVALKASEERYRWLVESTSEAIWRIEFDPPIPTDLPEDEQVARIYRDRRLAECNEGMARMYGFASAAEMLRLPLDALMPEAEAINRDYLRAFVRSGYRLLDAESVDRARDGSVRYVLNNLVGIVEDGRLLRAWGTSRDITGRRQAEEAVRASEERLRFALQSAQAGAWLWEMAEDRIVWSEEMYCLYGFDPQSTVPSLETWLAPVRSEDRDCVQKMLEETLARHRQEYQVEFRIEHPDLGLRWLLSRGRATYRDDGQPLRLSGITMDITDRKWAELALRESEERFRSLADSAPVLIWMSGPDKGGVYFNRIWLDFTGRSLEEERGEGWLSGIHPDDLGALAACEEAFAARRSFETQFRLRRHDGVYRWMLDTGTPRFTADGAFAGYIGSCLDITDQKRAEEGLRAALAEKETLLREIHHRVKNNLQVISGLLGIQARTVGPELIPYFEDTQERIRTMARVHEHLQHSEQEASFDLGRYLENLCADVSHIYGGAAARVTCRVEAVPVSVPFEAATPLVLMVNEALSNAFKHAFPDGRPGEISIAVRRIDRQVVLTIRDNGIGLPQGALCRREGSMGLRLIEVLARQIGGTATFETDGGTAFILSLPDAALDEAGQDRV